MLNKLSLCLSLIICGVIFSAPFSRSPAPAQSSAQEKPKLEDFGSSLKRLRWDSKKKTLIEDERKKESEKDSGEEDVLRVETSLVVSDVLVLDQKGRAVEGLTRDDFIVTEDGMPQQVGAFSLGGDTSIPRSIVLIIDYSGSQYPYLKTSIEAAKTLVGKLGPTDRMAIVTDEVKLLAGFTQDKRKLKEKLESLKALAERDDARMGWFAGHSLQYSALMATLRELFDEEDVRPIIIFQTDGDELQILRRTDGEKRPGVTETKQFRLEDVYMAAERSRVTIYSIIPGPRLIGLPRDEQLRRAKASLGGFLSPPAVNYGALPPSSLRRVPDKVVEWMIEAQPALARLAQVTGGWTDFLENPRQAAKIYSRIFEDVNRRYVIGYYPTNKEHDGRRRKVIIEVRGHPEYTIWGRKSYYAPSPDE